MKLFRFRLKASENKRLLNHDSLAIELNELDDKLDESKFKDIPDEILLMILFYFDIEFICNKISYVSKRFARLSQDFTIFRTLFNRDFPSIWPDINKIQLTYKAFYNATKNPNLDPVTQALLRMRGYDAHSMVKPDNLTTDSLLIIIGKRPLIRIFSRNQPQLNVIYSWLKLNMINRFLDTSYQLLLCVLCNQHAGFTHRFSKAIKKMPLIDVDRLMYLSVLLGYQHIIHGLSTLRPDADLQKLNDGLTYSEIALIEGNGQALNVLLEKGVPLQTPHSLRTIEKQAFLQKTAI